MTIAITSNTHRRRWPRNDGVEHSNTLFSDVGSFRRRSSPRIIARVRLRDQSDGMTPSSKVANTNHHSAKTCMIRNQNNQNVLASCTEISSLKSTRHLRTCPLGRVPQAEVVTDHTMRRMTSSYGYGYSLLPYTSIRNRCLF